MAPPSVQPAAEADGEDLLANMGAWQVIPIPAYESMAEVEKRHHELVTNPEVFASFANDVVATLASRPQGYANPMDLRAHLLIDTGWDLQIASIEFDFQNNLDSFLMDHMGDYVELQQDSYGPPGSVVYVVKDDSKFAHIRSVQEISYRISQDKAKRIDQAKLARALHPHNRKEMIEGRQRLLDIVNELTGGDANRVITWQAVQTSYMEKYGVQLAGAEMKRFFQRDKLMRILETLLSDVFIVTDITNGMVSLHLKAPYAELKERCVDAPLRLQQEAAQQRWKGPGRGGHNNFRGRGRGGGGYSNSHNRGAENSNNNSSGGNQNEQGSSSNLFSNPGTNGTNRNTTPGQQSSTIKFPPRSQQQNNSSNSNSNNNNNKPMQKKCQRPEDVVPSFNESQLSTRAATPNRNENHNGQDDDDGDSDSLSSGTFDKAFSSPLAAPGENRLKVQQQEQQKPNQNNNFLNQQQQQQKQGESSGTATTAPKKQPTHTTRNDGTYTDSEICTDDENSIICDLGIGRPSTTKGGKQDKNVLKGINIRPQYSMRKLVTRMPGDEGPKPQQPISTAPKKRSFFGYHEQQDAGETSESGTLVDFPIQGKTKTNNEKKKPEIKNKPESSSNFSNSDFTLSSTDDQDNIFSSRRQLDFPSKSTTLSGKTPIFVATPTKSYDIDTDIHFCQHCGTRFVHCVGVNFCGFCGFDVAGYTKMSNHTLSEQQRLKKATIKGNNRDTSPETSKGTISKRAQKAEEKTRLRLDLNTTSDIDPFSDDDDEEDDKVPKSSVNKKPNVPLTQNGVGNLTLGNRKASSSARTTSKSARKTSIWGDEDDSDEMSDAVTVINVPTAANNNNNKAKEGSKPQLLSKQALPPLGPSEQREVRQNQEVAPANNLPAGVQSPAKSSIWDEWDTDEEEEIEPINNGNTNTHAMQQQPANETAASSNRTQTQSVWEAMKSVQFPNPNNHVTSIQSLAETLSNAPRRELEEGNNSASGQNSAGKDLMAFSDDDLLDWGDDDDVDEDKTPLAPNAPVDLFAAAKQGENSGSQLQQQNGPVVGNSSDGGALNGSVKPSMMLSPPPSGNAGTAQQKREPPPVGDSFKILAGLFDENGNALNVIDRRGPVTKARIQEEMRLERLQAAEAAKSAGGGTAGTGLSVRQPPVRKSFFDYDNSVPSASNNTAKRSLDDVLRMCKPSGCIRKFVEANRDKITVKTPTNDNNINNGR